MFSKSILILAFFSVILMNLTDESNSCCFTMPPKIVKVSKWAFSVPNVESSSYIHESHICPNGYNIESQHSHIITRMTRPTIIDLSIYGYTVCCEKKIIYINKYAKNETLKF